jgi:hypothetical protein
MCHWIVVGMLKKKSCDFSRLKVVPEASLKSESMVWSLEASMAVGVFRARYHQQTGCEKLSVGAHE